ncbi:hypothetical protein [Helicobacter pylori]|nr:hypothetical protein [Helicobacter pylori]
MDSSKLNQSNLNASFYQIIPFLDYKQQHNDNMEMVLYFLL